ncbi:MAG: hypothetical protein ACUVXF_09835, partial [Desulfobaccales bacterium]
TSVVGDLNNACSLSTLQFRIKAILMTVGLVAGLFQAGGALAQDAYTFQYLVTNSASNFVLAQQGIGGWYVPNFSDSGTMGVSFNNVVVTGLYNVSYGLGSFRNQGSQAFVNIQPNEKVPPAGFLGMLDSNTNRATITDYNYAINLNFNGFQSSGILVLNLMAGSFSNQLTSVAFTMGRNVVAPPSPPNAVILTGNPSLVSLSNQQMAAIAATADNDIQVTGKQSAVATIQGTPNFQGLSAITMSAGINNQVIHRVELNLNTGN